MWKLRIEDDQANRTVVNLVRQEYTVGRAEDNDVRLTERNVSRHHAKLERSSDGWLLTDLESYTGCYVDEQRISGQVSLGHDTRLRVGDYDILLYDDAQESIADRDAMTVPAPLPSEPGGALPDRFVVLEGPHEGAEYPLGDRRLLIGRGEECDIALNDTSVSRVHADIERDDSGRYKIGDLGSSNGVRVNGMEVQSTTLYSGDIVELGDVELQFVPAGQVFTRTDHPRAGGSGGGLWQQLTRAQRWTTAGVGAAVLGTALYWVAAPTQHDDARGAQSNEAARALETAKVYFSKGDLDAAFAALQHIKPESNLRESGSFRRIAASWADHQLEQAEDSSDIDLQRRLLDAVARSETVDSNRRRRAADLLAQLNATGLNPSDLPEAMAEDESDAGDEAETAGAVVEEIEEVAANAPAPRSPPRPKPRPPPRPPATQKTAPVRQAQAVPPAQPTPAETAQPAPQQTVEPPPVPHAPVPAPTTAEVEPPAPSPVQPVVETNP